MRSRGLVPLPQTVDAAAVFAAVGGVAPLVRVVRSVLGAVTDPHVVVATVPALAAEARHCLHGAGLDDVAVAVAHGPGSRQHVLAAGLKHLGAEQHSSMRILVGDHRHPLAPGEVADRVIAALHAGHDVVVPTLPVTDTVKRVDELGSVLGTVDRSELLVVQYPRGYTASALWELIAGPSAPDFDEFDAALGAGLDIGTVDGDANASHVELPRDAHLLDAIIACRPE